MISYKKDVLPIISQYCIACHDASSNIVLSDYSHVQSFAKSGQLIGCISGDPNYSLMPPTQKMDTLLINKIIKWVNNGALDN